MVKKVQRLPKKVLMVLSAKRDLELCGGLRLCALPNAHLRESDLEPIPHSIRGRHRGDREKLDSWCSMGRRRTADGTSSATTSASASSGPAAPRATRAPGDDVLVPVRSRTDRELRLLLQREIDLRRANSCVCPRLRKGYSARRRCLRAGAGRRAWTRRSQRTLRTAERESSSVSTLCMRTSSPH